LVLLETPDFCSDSVGGNVDRRRFCLVLGVATAWPLAARTQQPAAMPVVGWIGIPSAGSYAGRVAAFREGLKELGLVEGETVAVEYRWADGRNERLAELAAELVARRVAVIVTGGGTPAALAAKAATTTIPILFTVAADPVRAGLVPSLSRPGGNVTGIGGHTDMLIVKRLELLIELVPKVSVVGALLNPSNRNFRNRAEDLEAAARALGRRIRLVGASNSGELDSAFGTAVAQGVQALVVQNDALFSSLPDRLSGLALRYRLPTVFENHEDAAAGGLVSYGPSWTERYRLLGRYTGRVLKGERPADLPIVQPAKFELAVNLRTARTLGVDVPLRLLQRADHVIE
jgi:putative ABC transport system substrate-binding protein